MDNLLTQAVALLQDDWVIYALPLFFTALMIEWVIAWRKSLTLYERQDFLASMGVMLLTVVIDVLPKLGGVLLMFVCWEFSPLKDVVSRAPQWWVLLFFLDDLTYYSFHRANHEVRFYGRGTSRTTTPSITTTAQRSVRAWANESLSICSGAH